jgi:hypothetical protein
MGFKVGGPFKSLFTTSNATGTASNADSLPTAKMSHNNVDDGTVSFTIANLDAGRYTIAATIPGGYAAGDVITVTVISVIGGNTIKQVIWNGPLDDVAVTASAIAAAIWNSVVTSFTTAGSFGYQFARLYASLHGAFAATYPDPTHVNTTFKDTDGTTTIVTSAIVLDSSGRPISRTIT